MIASLSNPSSQSPIRFFDHGKKTVLTIAGEDSASWLQGIVTADIRELDGASGDGEPAGSRALRSLCLDRLGKIQGEFFVLKVQQAYQLILLSDAPDSVIAHLKRLRVMEDVEISKSEGGLYSAHGQPLASHPRCDDRVPSALHACVTWLTDCDTITFVPEQASASVVFRGPDGAAVPSDAQSWEQFRIERGLPLWGVDYGPTENPATAGLVAGTVSQSKGCYLGQEVVCKLLMRGALRETTALMRFKGRPKVGAAVHSPSDAAPVGILTSVGRPEGEWVYALGRLRTHAIESEAQVVADDAVGQILPRRPA